MKGGWRTVHRKRVFDLGSSLPVFVLRLPVRAIVASLVYRGLASPVLFREGRPDRRNICAGLIRTTQQVSRRNALTRGREFEVDVDYVDHSTHRGDLSILLAAACTVLGRNGIAAEDSVTMQEFMGTPRGDG